MNYFNVRICFCREELENMKKEKEEMQCHMQQQASSILHFKAYCKSVVSFILVAKLCLKVVNL